VDGKWGTTGQGRRVENCERPCIARRCPRYRPLLISPCRGVSTEQLIRTFFPKRAIDRRIDIPIAPAYVRGEKKKKKKRKKGRKKKNKGTIAMANVPSDCALSAAAALRIFLFFFPSSSSSSPPLRPPLDEEPSASARRSAIFCRWHTRSSAGASRCDRHGNVSVVIVVIIIIIGKRSSRFLDSLLARAGRIIFWK